MNETDRNAKAMSADGRKLLALLKDHESKFPWKTAEQFPHVVEKLAALWEHPPGLRAYLQQLLLTRRETRQGFPLEIYSEIDALDALYDELHPLTKKVKDNFWTWV